MARRRAPHGPRISDDDQGPAKFEIRSYGPSHEEPGGVCVVQFPADTRWIGLPPDELETFIRRLQEHLAELRAVAGKAVR
jgi:hypothetical protein